MSATRHTQLSLLDRERSIQERFRAFDEANPWVWEAYERHALELIAEGWKHYSSDHILHVVRYHHDRETRDTDGRGFKLNNDFTSRYARKFAAAHPEHAEFFEQRRLAS